MPFSKEMVEALKADGEKLKQMTGDDHGPEFEVYLNSEDDDIEENEESMAEMMCGMYPDGQCGQAGSEYCEFECPFRD